MTNNKFDIANSARDAWGARGCTQQELEALQASPDVKAHCDEAADVFNGWTEDTPDAETRRMKDEAAKHKMQLPVVLTHAHFKDGHRCNASAVESGLFSNDIDHVADPVALWTEKIKPHKDVLHIVWAFVSPTRTGVKVVCEKPQNLTIEQAQAWFAEVCGLTDYDHTHDLARCCYLVTKEYNLHYDPERLFGETAEYTAAYTSSANTPANTPAATQSAAVAKTNATDISSLLQIKYNPEARFRGVLYSTIAEAFWKMLHGEIHEGMRHQAWMEWVKDAACICEYNAERLMEVTPRLKDNEEELARIIINTLEWKGNHFSPTIPATMSRVLTELGMNSEEMAETIGVETFNQSYLSRMPKLPPSLRAALKGVDPKYHLGVIYGLLPAYCSFAEKVLYRHCDHSLRRPTLFTFVVGPAASGKDNVTRRYRALMSKQEAADIAARDKNDTVRNKNLTKGANEQGKVEDQFVKQRALKITHADLLRWMKLSRKLAYKVGDVQLGRKVLMFTAEAGIVRKAIKDDDLMVDWRLGFDGDKMSSDRYSANAVSGDENICLDIIAACTPGVLKSLVGKESQEDGTASRLLIAFVPGDPYAEMPYKEEASEEDKAEMQRGLQLCADCEGVLDFPNLRRKIEAWNNDIGHEAKKTGDIARAMLRRRAAIMGMCAGIIAAILWDKRDKAGMLTITKPAIDFALLTAEYVMETQCAVFGDYAMNTAMDFSFSKKKHTKNQDLYDRLPATFTRKDIMAEKPDVSKQAISNIISRMKADGMIAETEKGIYVKMKNEE